MKIKIDSMISLSDVPDRLFKQIKTELTINNPDYVKKLRMGLPMWGVPRKFELFKGDIKLLVLPRGYYSRLKQLIKEFAVIVQVETNVVRGKLIGFNSNINLRDYQKPAIEAVAKFHQGVIIMPCGSGKTVTGLQCIASIRTPTLWLTHTRDLANQTLSNAIENLNLKDGDYGIIAGSEFNIGSKITVGMIQTLAKRDLSKIAEYFGCIVIDECHHVFKDHKTSRLFESVISQFPAAYRIGLTASEHRSDGLIETMFHVIGPKIYEVTQDKLNSENNVVVPKVEFIPTEFTYSQQDGEMIKFAQMLKAIASDSIRNNIIIKNLLNQNDNSVLVLGDSLEHLELLKNSLSRKLSSSQVCEFICGSTPKTQREKILTDMRNKKINYLFATYQLAKEGLDIPCLDRLFMLTPKKDRVVVQQSVGRIMRKYSGKNDAIVYDFIDERVKTCIYQARERIKIYKSLGCKIDGQIKNKKDDKK